MVCASVVYSGDQWECCDLTYAAPGVSSAPGPCLSPPRTRHSPAITRHNTEREREQPGIPAGECVFCLDNLIGKNYFKG